MDLKNADTRQGGSARGGKGAKENAHTRLLVV
jgi:hypothetical protein